MNRSDKPKASILAQANMDGYREGWGQAALVAHDEAYEAGFQAGLATATGKVRQAFFAGATATSAICAALAWWLS